MLRFALIGAASARERLDRARHRFHPRQPGRAEEPGQSLPPPVVGARERL